MSGNLFNDPRINKSAYKKSLETYLMILVSINVPIQNSGNIVSMCPNDKSLETFNDPRIHVPIRKKSGNLFNDKRINKSAHASLETFNDLCINRNAPTKKVTRINKSAHTKNVWNFIE